MPNNYLSVLYQHIIQVENKNVGLKVEGHKHTIAPPPRQKNGGGHMPPLPPPPPASYASASGSETFPTPATTPGWTAGTPLYLPVQSVPHSLPLFFPLSRTEEPTKAGTCARDRRTLQQLALNSLT